MELRIPGTQMEPLDLTEEVALANAEDLFRSPDWRLPVSEIIEIKRVDERTIDVLYAGTGRLRYQVKNGYLHEEIVRTSD